MIVVTDTSVVLNLCFVRQDALLPHLFDLILAPSAVRDEFQRLARDVARFRGLSFPAFIVVEDPQTVPEVLRLAQALDPGERAALALALEKHAPEVLVDELVAREVAEKLGLRVAGVLAILIRAKRRNLLPSVSPVLDGLEKARFWISPQLRQQVLKEAGEN